MTPLNFIETLASIYRVRSDIRAPLLEDILGFQSNSSASEDDVRNEKRNFEKLFSDQCRGFVDALYRDAMLRIAGKAYGDAGRDLQVLVYLQYMVAIALWKFGLEPGKDLESFARDFDRLDVESERKRLYDMAVQSFESK